MAMLNAKDLGTIENMGRSFDEVQRNGKRPSLTNTLSILQRKRLLQLLVRLSSIQNQWVRDVFSADAALNPEYRGAFDSSSRDRKDTLNPSVDPGKADVNAFDSERKKLTQWEKELRKLHIAELHTAAMSWYTGWRRDTVLRVGESVRLRKAAMKELDCKGSMKSKDASGPYFPERPCLADAENRQRTKVTNELASLQTLTSTSLDQLEYDKKLLILNCILPVLLSSEHYHSPSRTLLTLLCTSLKMPIQALNDAESRVSKHLIEDARQMSVNEEAARAEQEPERTKKWQVAMATTVGATVIGITGGFAAPLIGTSVGGMVSGMGSHAATAAGYLGSLASSPMLIGGLFGAYGARTTGQMMDRYAKEVNDFSFIPVHGSPSVFKESKGQYLPTLYPNRQNRGSDQTDDLCRRRLRVTIGVSGWLTSKDEVVRPWRVLGQGSEAFALRFELETLLSLGNAMQDMVSNAAWAYAKQLILKRTLVADLTGAMSWPVGLAHVSRIVDNPFTLAKSRADKVGRVLADAIIGRVQGERPVALVGFSLGARVIFSCLNALADRRAFGLIESAVLIGAPVPATSLEWRKLGAVVSGRLVNVYCKNDYILSYLYRASSAQLGAAGLQEVSGVCGVENVDVSEMVSGHLRYRHLVGRILRRINWQDLDISALAMEQETLENTVKDLQGKSMEISRQHLGRTPAGVERPGEETIQPENIGFKENEVHCDDQISQQY